MAIVIDQASIATPAHPGGTGTTVSITTNVTVAANGFIVLCIGDFGSVGQTIIDNIAGGGLTWTVDQQGRVPPSNARGVAIASAQAPSGLASGTTITCTYDELTSARTMGGMSFTGVKTSNPVDGTPTAPTGAATAAWETPSYTIQAGSVIVAYDWNESNNSGNTPTAPSLEAWENQDAGGPKADVCEYRIEAAAGSYTVAGTWGSASNTTNIAVAYLAAEEAVVGVENRFTIRHSRMTSW